MRPVDEFLHSIQDSFAANRATSLVGLGLSTSKVRTYAPPRPKQVKGWPFSKWDSIPRSTSHPLVGC